MIGSGCFNSLLAHPSHHSGLLPFEEFVEPPFRTVTIYRIPQSQLEDPAFLREVNQNGWKLKSYPDSNGSTVTDLIRFEFDPNELRRAVEFDDLRPSFDSESAPFLKNIAVRCWQKDPNRRPLMVNVVRRLEAECSRQGPSIVSSQP